jgi:hypothetical protein
VTTFDSRTHDFYWYGHRLDSPITFTLVDHLIVANGIRPEPDDTTGSSAALAARFGGIPFVRAKVEAGHSYLQALNEYQLALSRMARTAVRSYRLAPRKWALQPNRLRAAVVDTLLVDTSSPISINATTFRATLRDGTPYVREFRSADALNLPLVRDTSVRDVVADARSRIFMAVLDLKWPRPAVVIATQDGFQSFSGGDVPRVRAEIERAVRLGTTSGSLISEGLMAQIVRARVRGGSGH